MSDDFFHGNSEKYDEFQILTFLHEHDIVVMCEKADLEKFIRSFEKVTQRFGLTTNIKKTCLMSLQ